MAMHRHCFFSHAQDRNSGNKTHLPSEVLQLLVPEDGHHFRFGGGSSVKNFITVREAGSMKQENGENQHQFSAN